MAYRPKNTLKCNSGSEKDIGILLSCVLLVIFLVSVPMFNMDVNPIQENLERDIGFDFPIKNNDLQTPLTPREKTSTRSQPDYHELISYDDVLVIRNLNSPMSMQIADYFQAKRNISNLNICNITTSSSETINRTIFENEIRIPVEDYIVNNGLENTINFIVTTKGVPLRISEENPSDDNWNNPYTIDRASVDSELTLILGYYSIFIGGGGFMMTTPITYLQNPYYNSYEEFSRSTFDIFLVTRLTGYDLDQIKAYIDQVPEAVGKKGTFVFDEDPGNYPEGNQWMTDANATLTAKGFNVIHDQTNAFLTNNENISGYTGWGSNHGGYSSGVNLNYGFETDSNGDRIPDNWFIISDIGNDQIDRNDTDKCYDSWSVRINRNVANINFSAISQNISIKPNTRYFLRGQVNISAVSGGKGAHLNIRAYDDLDQLVWEKNGSSRTGTTSSWVSLNQIIYEPIDNVTKITVSAVLSEASGEAYFDDIRLIEIKPHNSWLPGALVETYVSTSGRTFNYPPSYGQSLAADLILDGVSGTKAYVYEPYLSACAHPDILFDAYTDGFYSAESYYMASEFLSWMDVVVCDPKLAVYNQSLIPDLVISPGDISFSDNQPQSGDIITIYANVHNIGNYSANKVLVYYYDGDPQGGGTLFGESMLDISPQDQNQTSLSWNTSGYIGDYDITIVVDPKDKFYELDESNNMANKSIIVESYPIADAGLDGIVDEDSPYTFNGSGSTDKTGIANYTWDFKDGNFGYGETPIHTYTSQGLYMVLLNVTNVHGFSDLDYVNITVNNVAPAAEAGTDKTGFEGQPLNFNASDSIDTPSDVATLNYTWDFGDGNIGYGINITHVYEDNGIYVVNLIVRDDDFTIGIDILNVTLNNSPPFLEPVPLQIIQEDASFILNIIASDVSGDTIIFSDNSSMFDIDSATGEINFTPRNEDVGIHLINISAIDDDGGESFIEFLITIENTNDPPYIVSSPITEAVEENLYQYDVVVEDDDTLVSNEVFTYFLDSSPSGMEIDSSGRITWTPSDAQASQIFEVIIRVSDGEDYDIQNFNITVSNINDAPLITSTPVTSADEDLQYVYDVEATDVDIGDVLTYELDLAPQGMNIDGTSGVISWIPTNDDVGNNNVIIKVRDSWGAYDTQVFSIWVSNVNDAPELEYIGELIATEEQPFYHQVNATDVDSGDTISFYDDSELFDIDSNTGIISFTPSNADVGTYTVKITVSDYQGITDYESITLRVLNVNDPPFIDEEDVLFLSDVVSLSAGEAFAYQINAFDEDAEDTLIFSDDADLFDINPTTGEIAFTPEKKDVGMHIVKITVTDEDGDTDYMTVTFEVVGEEEDEGIDLIWLWLVLVMVIVIIIIIVFVFWKRKKVKPVEEPFVVEVYEEGIVMKTEGQKQNFPPPPPPPP